MTIPEIVQKLTLYTGRFPKRAMRAALEQQEAITPELLDGLARVARDPAGFAAENTESMLHVFGIYLLAQFREKRACPLIARILAAPGETAFDLFGDTVTEAGSRILGSVYDGNPGLIETLVESPGADEFVRALAIDAFIVLERSGQIDREAVVEYFRSLFGGGLERQPSYAWDGLVSAVADLPAPELLEELRQAYQDGLADPMVAGLEELERNISQPRMDHSKWALVTDAIAEMEWWDAFQPKAGTRIPKIGRNDRCPCGSGKKYKKCCGA